MGKSYQSEKLMSYIWKNACRNDPWQPTGEKVIWYISEFTYKELILFTCDAKNKTPK